MASIDLNADLGEEITDDAGLLALVTSANVACGYHAGSPAIMREVCDGAVERGVVVGAQVSYADRPNFGRVPVEVAYEILREQVAHQVGLLADAAAAAGTSVQYVKPHGALYHRVLDDEAQALAVLDGSGVLPLLTMPGVLGDLAWSAGRGVVLEGFPDRGCDEHGRLLPRDLPGAVLHESDAIAARAVELAHAGVRSVCVHGDTPGAVEHARAVRTALRGAGFELAAFV